MMVEGTKRFAMWTVCELNEAGLYQLRGEIMRKKDREVIHETHDFPLLATAHFYDRLMQGFRFDGHTLITTLVDVVRLLIEEVGIDESSVPEKWPAWRSSGNVWFALDYGLAAGDIPLYGEVVLRTIMPRLGDKPASLLPTEYSAYSGRARRLAEIGRAQDAQNFSWRTFARDAFASRPPIFTPGTSQPSKLAA
jgi:hypothetical protein